MFQGIKEKWVDYTDSESDFTESQPSLLQNPQLLKLQKINKKNKFVWLDVRCSSLTQDAKQKIKKIRFQEKDNTVFESKNFDGFEIKVSRNKAFQYLSQSIPGIYGANITVSDKKNFKSQNQVKTQFRGQRKVQSQLKNRFSDSRSRKNVKYVNKETGQKANNNALLKQRLIQEQQRKYSKKQAKDIGDKIGAFRNKKQIDKKQLAEVRNQYLNEQTTLKKQRQKQKQKIPEITLKKTRSQPHLNKLKSTPKRFQSEVWKRREQPYHIQSNEKKYIGKYEVIQNKDRQHEENFRKKDSQRNKFFKSPYRCGDNIHQKSKKYIEKQQNKESQLNINKSPRYKQK